MSLIFPAKPFTSDYVEIFRIGHYRKVKVPKPNQQWSLRYLHDMRNASDALNRTIGILERNIRIKCCLQHEPDYSDGRSFDYLSRLCSNIYMGILEHCDIIGCFCVSFTTRDIINDMDREFSKYGMDEIKNRLSLFVEHGLLSQDSKGRYKVTDAFTEILDETIAACGV